MERNTRQRGAIKRVFQRATRPLAPAEILTEARREVGHLGIATVYRTLKSLTDERWLAAVELVGEPARYELAGTPDHHHFRCRRCGWVFDVPCACQPLDGNIPQEFRLERHEMVLHGLCSGCQF